MPSCCICLCVYNNEIGLPFILKNIDTLREACLFDNIQILVFYDISKDSSLQILKNYKNGPILIHENPSSISLSRVERIAYARNGLLQMIRDNFQNYEYFAMMDSNDYSCVGRIKPHILREILQRKDEWDSVSFDREDGYYDFWALSYNPYIYSFYHFKDYKQALEKLKNDFHYIIELLRKTNPKEFFRVYSAFNGFAIYKTGVFIECRYSSDINILAFPPNSVSKHSEIIQQLISRQTGHDCEHRFFHLDAIRRKDARIFISLLSLFEKTNKSKNSFGLKTSDGRWTESPSLSSNTSTFLMKSRTALKRTNKSMNFNL